MGTLAPWALVLAAGDGTRLRDLTTDGRGNTIPKQFCSLNGGVSLLQLALLRAAQVIPWERVTTVVAARHASWWQGPLAFLPEQNVIVQPRNRGTAIGVLLPLLCILSQDPRARIVLLPSDHFVADEGTLAQSMRKALAELDRRPERVVMLGIVPDDDEFFRPGPSALEGVVGRETLHLGGKDGLCGRASLLGIHLDPSAHG